MSNELISSFLPVPEKFPKRPLTLVVGATFGPFYINFFATNPVLIGTFSANPTTDTLTLANHGLLNGTMVQVTATASDNITDGLESGELYFVSNADGNKLQLSFYHGGLGSSIGAVIDITGSQQCILYRCGTPYNLTNHKVWAWVKHFVTDADNNLVLDLQPSIVGADLLFGYDWRVTFTKTKAQTFNMTPGNHVWDFLIQFPDGTRKLLVEGVGFIIKLPATHPNLIS